MPTNPPFTPIIVTDEEAYADGTPVGPGSYVDFLLTVPLINSSTGATVAVSTITAAYNSEGHLLDPDTGDPGVVLPATDDPATTPVGAAYKITKRIVGEPRRVFYVALPHTAPEGTVALGLLTPGDTAPPISYALQRVQMPDPFVVTRQAGVDVVTVDTTGANVGDVLTLLSLAPDVLGLATPTGGGGGTTGDMHWRGLWDAGTTYAVGDTVAFYDATDDTTLPYVAILPALGDAEDPLHHGPDHWDAIPVPPAMGVTNADGSVEVDALQFLQFNGGTLEQISTGQARWTPDPPPALSDDPPAPLGTADPGTSPAASRADHMHDTLTLADLGGASTADLATESSDRTTADTTLSDLLTAEASTARAAEGANATAISTHSGQTTTAHGGIVASTDPRLTNTRFPTAHTHSGDGSGTIPNATTSAAGLLSGADKTKLDQFAPASGKTLTVSNALTLAGTDGDTATLPSGGGTLALRGSDNAFTAAQGVRDSVGGNAAGLYVPWISGDTAQTLLAGSSTSGNTQTAIKGLSDSGTGVSGQTATNVGVQGVMSGAGTAALEGRYTGSSTGTVQLLLLRNATTGAGAAGTGSTILTLCKSDTTAGRNQTLISSVWATATDASRAGRLTLAAYDSAGVREGLRVEASGTAPLLGFFGHAAGAVPTVTGTQNANAALASMLSGLAGLGLITDSSTTGTAPAFPNADNAFSVAQGIRAAHGTNADGLYVPWITGDTHATATFGSATTGNDQAAVKATSDSNVAVLAASSSQVAVQGTTATSTGVLGIMSGSGTTALEGRYTGSGTGLQNLLLLRNSTSGTGATGTGDVLGFLAKSDTTASRFQADLTTSWGGSATDASRKARLVVSVYDTAAREILRGEASGTAPMIGFLGSAAQAKPTITGSRGSNAALASLLTALAAYGLITDSSS